MLYVSTYENRMSFEGKGEEFGKWAAGVLHEVLSLFVPKKTEKDNILFLGDYLGVGSRNPKFANSGNFRDQTASFSKVQVPNCNFTGGRRKIPCLAGEDDPGMLRPSPPPDHIYKSPGT
ncbi:hypothetical protein AgCh_026618 [Apium graveolens]